MSWQIGGTVSAWWRDRAVRPDGADAKMHPLFAPTGAKFSDGTWKNLTFYDSEQRATRERRRLARFLPNKSFKTSQGRHPPNVKTFLCFFQPIVLSFQYCFRARNFANLLKKMTLARLHINLGTGSIGEILPQQICWNIARHIPANFQLKQSRRSCRSGMYHPNFHEQAGGAKMDRKPYVFCTKSHILLKIGKNEQIVMQFILI